MQRGVSPFIPETGRRSHLVGVGGTSRDYRGPSFGGDEGEEFGGGGICGWYGDWSCGQSFLSVVIVGRCVHRRCLITHD